MSLDLDQVCTRIDELHLDELDLIITRDGNGFTAAEHRSGGPYVSDIGSSYEVPDAVDERGRGAFTAGPWTAFQYHASFYAPNRNNYIAELEDLAAGRIRAVICGVTAICENDTWVFGIRTEN